MPPQPQAMLGPDKERNAQIMRWLIRRMSEARSGLGDKLPMPPGTSEADLEPLYREWGKIEFEWNLVPNSYILIQQINGWIERVFPAGKHAAGKERQKLLMTLRSIRAGYKRRNEGALRFEFDLELSNRISQCCDELRSETEKAEKAQSGERKRGKSDLEALFVRTALNQVLGNQDLIAMVKREVLEAQLAAA